MLITATTAILFYVIGISSVAIGHWMRRLEIYAFGFLLIFLFSGFVLYNGISVQTGSIQIIDNSTLKMTESYTFDQNKDLWVNFLGVGGLLLATFLAINTYQEYEQEQLRKRDEE